MRNLRITTILTPRTSPAIEKYLQDVARIPLLSVEEEVDLAQRIQKGDKEALDKLVEGNLRFVITVAKQYSMTDTDLMDLINEGNTGLIRAAEKFDPSRGFKFISYAVWWIRQAIIQSYSESRRTMRLPLNQLGRIRKVNKAVTALEQELSRTPTSLEIAEKIDEPLWRVEEALDVGQRTVSLDIPFTNDTGKETTLAECTECENTPTPDYQTITDSLASDLTTLLGGLTEREQRVLRMAFGIDCPEMSLETIGDEMSLTRERVRQIKERALKKLRESEHIDYMRDFL